jgi:hypothetical protein
MIHYQVAAKADFLFSGGPIPQTVLEIPDAEDRHFHGSSLGRRRVAEGVVPFVGKAVQDSPFELFPNCGVVWFVFHLHGIVNTRRGEGLARFFGPSFDIGNPFAYKFENGCKQAFP